MNAPKTKSEMYNMYVAGVFGNSPKIFFSLEEMEASGKVLFGLRYAGTSGGGRFKSLLTFNEVKREYYKWLKDGLDKDRIVLCEAINPEDVVFQGEIMRSVNYIDLTYTTEPNVFCRPSTWKKRQVSLGLSALMLCRKYMDDLSFSILEDIFNYFDDDFVVEFSTMNKAGRFTCNTVFWEVRNY